MFVSECVLFAPNESVTEQTLPNSLCTFDLFPATQTKHGDRHSFVGHGPRCLSNGISNEGESGDRRAVGVIQPIQGQKMASAGTMNGSGIGDLDMQI